MNTLTLDGAPINSTIGRVETFTKQDIEDATEAGIKIGQDFAEHQWKGRALRAEADHHELKDEYRLLTNALAGALLALDGGKLTPEMRKTLDAALERAEEIGNG